MNRTKSIMIVGSALLAGLAVLSWTFVLSPRLGKPAEIAAQTESVEAQTARLEGEFANLTTLQQDLPGLVARFDQLKATFPTTAELPSVLDQVRAAASRAGVSVQQLETSAPQLLVAGEAAAAEGAADESADVPVAADGTLATMPMSVTVSGSISNVKAFLSATESMPRAWLINSVQAQGADEGSSITVTASGSMFVLDTTGITAPTSNLVGQV